MRSAVVLAAMFVFALHALAQAPVVPEGSVVNSASFVPGQAIAPGSLVTVFGTQFSAETAIASSIPLSTSLGSVSVTFNSIPAPMIGVYPAANALTAQVPWNVLQQGATSGQAVVVVSNASGNSTPIMVPVSSFSPGIFSLQFGQGQAAARIFPDNSFAAPPGSIPGEPARPAKAGEIITVYVNGLGPIDKQLPDGHAPAVVTNNMTRPTVLIGGVPADVQFAGLAGGLVGVNILNVVVPQGVQPGPAVPIQIEVGGVRTTDKVTIAVE